MKTERRCLSMVLLVVIAVLAAVPSAASAGGEGWLVSFKKAKALSKKSGKPIVADFTGSDWCGWCWKLKAEVFDTPEFKSWATKNVILLELDFPRKKPQSAALKAQNSKLRDKYGVRGYPTVLLLDPSGEEIGRLGYMKGGPGPWIGRCQKIIDSHSKVSMLQLAESLEAGLALAKKRKRPLLLVVSPTAADASRFNTGLAKSPEFVQFANSSMVVVHVDFSAEGSEDQAATFKQLKDRLRIKDTSRHVVLDAKGERLLYQSPVPKSDEALLAELAKALPEIGYDGGWLEDLAQAQIIARRKNRLILADFTGSDWCGWCKKLKAEVFDTPEFKSWAAKNVILLELDFPRKKPQSAALKAQNSKLRDKYGVRGYPTVLLLDPSGKKLGQLGYIRGGPKPFIAKVKMLVK